MERLKNNSWESEINDATDSKWFETRFQSFLYDNRLSSKFKTEILKDQEKHPLPLTKDEECPGVETKYYNKSIKNDK